MLYLAHIMLIILIIIIKSTGSGYKPRINTKLLKEETDRQNRQTDRQWSYIIIHHTLSVLGKVNASW